MTPTSSLRNLLLIVALFATTSFITSAQAAEITPDEREALINWSSREHGKGALLTPPVGKIQPEVRAAKKYLENMAEKLAGPHLRAMNANLVINIYASNEPNAWAWQMHPDHDFEKEWKDKHPNESWPIRKWLGFDDNGRPIYEVGFTTGLLHKLKYDAELAFIMAHELTHVLEGHTDPVDSKFERWEKLKRHFKKWLSSQSSETVADRGGTNLSVGHYDIDGGLMAMRKILDEPNKTKAEEAWKDAVYKSASTHHDQGLRISLLQFFREYLRRTRQDAAPMKLVELKTLFDLLIPGRDESYRILNEREQSRIENVIERYFLGGENYLFLTNDRPSGYKFKDHYEFYQDQIWDILERGQEDPRILHDILMLALDRIDASGAAAKQKVNAILMTAAVMQRICPETFGQTLDRLTDQEALRFTRALAKYSAEGKWSFADLEPQLGQLRKHVDQWKTSQGVLESTFMSSVKGQQILRTLIETNPIWRAYFHTFADISSLAPINSISGTELLKSKIGMASRFAHGALYKMHVEQVIREISKADPVTCVVNADMHMEGKYFSFIRNMNWIKQNIVRETTSDLGFGALLDSYNRAWVERQLGLALQNISAPKTETRSAEASVGKGRIEALRSLQEAADRGVVDVRNAEIVKAYLEFTRVTPTLDRASPDAHIEVHGPILDLTAAVLSDPSVSAIDKFNAVKVLCGMNGRKADWAMYGYRREQQIRGEIAAYFRSLSNAEIVRLFADDLSSSLMQFEAVEYRLSRVTPSLKQMNADERKKAINQLEMFETWRAVDHYMGQATAMIGFANAVGANDLLTRLSFEDIRKITLEMNRRHGRSTVMVTLGLNDPRAIAFNYLYETGDLLMKAVVEKRTEAKNFNEWFDTYERALAFAAPKYMLPEAQFLELRQYVEKSLMDWPVSQRSQWLRHENIRRVVSDSFMASCLSESVRLAVPRVQNRDELKTQVSRIAAQFSLQENYPDAFQLFRNQITKDFQVQPAEVELLFPEDQRSATEKANGLQMQVRGLSGLLAMTRGQKIADQIHMIEYLAGRRPDIPPFIAVQERHMRSYEYISTVLANGPVPPLGHGAQVLRNEIYGRTTLERAMIINSFLAGPNNMIQTEEGLKAVLDHLLSSVKPENREFARKLAEGLMRGEGANKSFVLGYVLAQRPDKVNTALKEVAVLNGFMQFYGAPGIKLAQYLAFSSDFKDYKQHLEVYQDAALPLTEFEAAKLIHTQLGDKWDPLRFKFLGLKGSGSVNVALEYLDLITGEVRVVSLLRENIEVKTQEDFRRFKALVEALLQDPNERGKYEFLLGLLNIIERSVALEFDKEHAMRMQRLAESIYNRSVNGWKIRTVKAREVIEKGLFMDMAPGVGARRVLREQPEMYRSAMAALLKVEDEMLRGIDSSRSPKPVPLFANPDLHDGQVLIDVNTREVTVIDFGQALPITNPEREFAVDLLRIASHVDSLEKAAATLESHAKLIGGAGADYRVDREKLAEVLARPERMDAFVHLISMLERSGFSVPLSSVHWVLGVNRAVVLGDKIGVPLSKRYRDLLIASKLKVGLPTYNYLRSTWSAAADRVRGWFGKGETRTTVPPRVELVPTAATTESNSDRRRGATPQRSLRCQDFFLGGGRVSAVEDRFVRMKR